MKQTLIIPNWLPEPLANGSHGHWSVPWERRGRAADRVWAYAVGNEWLRLKRQARLTVTLVFPVKRRRDTDNLYSRVKGLVDGLVRGKWIVDDSTEWLELVVKAEVRKGIKQTELELEAI